MSSAGRPGQVAREGGPEIRPIDLVDLPRLRFDWSSRYDRDAVEEILQRSSGLSVWLPDTGEYVLVDAWRHRSEIVTVLELSGTAHAVDLLDALARTAAERGKRLVILSEHHETRRRSFYERAGYALIEEILIYELSRLRVTLPALPDLQFERVAIGDEGALSELLEVDHAAFPWLWWNSREEFENYAQSVGVEMYLGRDASGTAVSYVGVTLFRNWGHLDRIAVIPNRQGQSLGWQSLDFACAVLGMRGARRIGLSTQGRNERSRRLYEAYGFHRVLSQDYDLYGRWLTEEPGEAEQ